MKATSPYLNEPTRKPVLWVNVCDPDDKGDWFCCQFIDEADAIDDVAQGRHGYRWTTIIFDDQSSIVRDFTEEAGAENARARRNARIGIPALCG